MSSNLVCAVILNEMHTQYNRNTGNNVCLCHHERENGEIHVENVMG